MRTESPSGAAACASYARLPASESDSGTPHAPSSDRRVASFDERDREWLNDLRAEMPPGSSAFAELTKELAKLDRQTAHYALEADPPQNCTRRLAGEEPGYGKAIARGSGVGYGVDASAGSSGIVR